MVIQEFRFGNYKSFKDGNTLDMNAAKMVSKDSKLDIDNVLELTESESIIRTKAIYGANASGKSNVINALTTFIAIVRDSVKDKGVFDKIEPFALATDNDFPTYFQLTFFDTDIRFRYGFDAAREGILNEWLFWKPSKREMPLFLREGQHIHDVSETGFQEGRLFLNVVGAEQNKPDGSNFKIDGLWLTVLASFGFGDIAKRLVQQITSIQVVSGLGNLKLMADAELALKDASIKSFMVHFLKHADFGINDLELLEFTEELTGEQTVKGKKASSTAMLSYRSVYKPNGDLSGRTIFHTRSQESEGTKKMIELSPLLYNLLVKGGVLVIDEFDARLHPLLTRKIVELVNSGSPVRAQLIFTTHDTSLLSADILRRDQIDFVEKDAYGASHLYSLVDFKGVRNNASFGKDYILGKYGAIPFLGGFGELKELLGDA